MTVSIPRRKLPGHNPPLSSMYAPSCPHQHDPRYMSTNERPGLHGYSYPNRSFSGGNANSDISMHSGFVMDPNAEDQIVPHKKEKKKKKHKHHHHRHQGQISNVKWLYMLIPPLLSLFTLLHILHIYTYTLFSHFRSFSLNTHSKIHTNH